MRKVLFVCTANLDRSPTAEKLFQNWRGRWEARSAGVRPVFGGNPLTQNLVDWADMVLVMVPYHAEYIYKHFMCNPDKVRVLDVSDIYVRDDPELIQELQHKVRPILDIEDRLLRTWEKKHSSKH